MEHFDETHILGEICGGQTKANFSPSTSAKANNQTLTIGNSVSRQQKRKTISVDEHLTEQKTPAKMAKLSKSSEMYLK